MLLALLVLLAGCSQPDFHDTGGNAYRYDDLHGNWLVINYWAVWCPPCITEIPELVALHENHADVQVFGVNFDNPAPDVMAAQIQKMKITFPVMAEDPRFHFGVERPAVMPTTLIVDPQGKLADVLIGPQTEASLLTAMGKPSWAK